MLNNNRMKKIFVLILVLTIFICSSCKKEKEEKKAENQYVSLQVKILTEEEKAVAQAIRQEQAKIPTASLSSIPAEYRKSAENKGTIEKISYKTKDYFEDGDEITKNAYVYLPAGYSEKNKYPVLYLMHGIGGSEAEWGMKSELSTIKLIMDNLIEKGEIEPFIVITPNGRSSKNFEPTGSNSGSFYVFGKELRNDLIPYMDSHYSTQADRNGRAMAGLSMGGMQTINIGICECLDLFSYFGAFSAAPTSYAASKVAAVIKENSKYPVKYFYKICGLEDNIAFAAAENAAKKLPELIPDLIDDENYLWKEVHGNHSFDVWYLGFYDFARIVFNK